jgi:hypothetical protein
MAKRKSTRSKRRRCVGGYGENEGQIPEQNKEYRDEDEDEYTEPQQNQMPPPIRQNMPQPQMQQTNTPSAVTTSPPPQDTNSYFGKIKNGFKTAKNKLYNWIFGIQNQSPPQSGGRRKRRFKTRKYRQSKRSNK